MNPHDELRSLLEAFPDNGGIVAQAEHIPASQTPEPYKTLLVHDQHMTVTMEKFHGASVDVEVLARHLEGDVHTRQSLLRCSRTGRVVQYGIVRFHLDYVTQAVRDEILAGSIPLGRVLIQHNVLRHIDLGAILRITAGPRLAALMEIPEGTVTYGRLATIFCNRAPAVDLLEISSPVD